MEHSFNREVNEEMNKIQRTMLSAYLSMKNKFDDFMKKEDGMETIQAIILVVVGIVIVGALIAIVGNKDDPNSLIGKIWAKISGLIDGGSSPY